MHFGLCCLLACAATATRGDAQGIFINEFMAANTEAVADPQGQYDDWIELYNASSAAIDVGDWYLTDDLSEPTVVHTESPAVIRHGRTISRGAVLVESPQRE